MPADFFVASVASLGGLMMLGLAAIAAVFLWYCGLGEEAKRIRAKPALLGEALALVMLALTSFVESWLIFGSRVERLLLSESERWTIVPNWMLYRFFLFVPFVMAALCVIALPAAWLARHGRFTFAPMLLIVAACCLVPAGLLWLEPGNEWSRLNRLASFLGLLNDMVFVIGFPVAGFLLGAWLVLRRLPPPPAIQQGASHVERIAPQ
jgi:hypothetical protein